jgi:hypothetical protein
MFLGPIGSKLVQDLLAGFLWKPLRVQEIPRESKWGQNAVSVYESPALTAELWAHLREAMLHQIAGLSIDVLLAQPPS